MNVSWQLTWTKSIVLYFSQTLIIPYIYITFKPSFIAVHHRIKPQPTRLCYPQLHFYWNSQIGNRLQIEKNFEKRVQLYSMDFCYISWQSYKMISWKNGQRQIWWESGFNCGRYQVNSQIQGVENVWNHHIIFWEVGDEEFEFSVLIYYSFTYILVPDVIFIFDRGRLEEDAVKNVS